MRSKICLVILLLLTHFSFAEAAPNMEAESGFISEAVDVGVVYPFSRVHARITLQNTGSEVLRISRISPRRERYASETSFGDGVFKPGQSIDVDVQFDAPERVGGMSRLLDVFGGKPERLIAGITIRGFVDWIVDPVSLQSDFGVWDVHQPVSRELAFKTRPGVDVRMKKVTVDGKFVSARIVEDGRALSVTTLKSSTWGSVEDSIEVETSSELQRKVVFHIKGEARGEVVPSSYMASFDPVREGESPEQTIRLTDQTGKKLRIGTLEKKGTEIQASLKECIPISESCKFLVLKLPPQELGSPPRGAIDIVLPDYKAVLPVFFGGTVIGKNTQIRNLNEALEKAKEQPESLSSVLKNATAIKEPLEMPMPDGSGPLITWRVAGEQSVYGYEIYRAPNESGPFARINQDILRRIDSVGDQGSIYRWRDNSATSGKVYWYYVGLVYTSGEKKSLTSPQKVLAK
jgi:hypothetical protein